MSRIASNLYLGSDEQAQSLHWLKSKGITDVINCAKELPNYFPKHFNYFRLDWDDTPDQFIKKKIEEAHSFVKEKSANARVFVHCYAGISRSSSVIIYFLMREHNMTFSQALHYVKQRRPIVDPNPGFGDQLIHLQKSLQRHQYFQ